MTREKTLTVKRGIAVKCLLRHVAQLFTISGDVVRLPRSFANLLCLVCESMDE